uniref:Uncharacterized protein n=1 Tax=Graphocephala atropunctata TaxID=36148 RepID=A0A1B6KRS0_9HEMI
MANWILLLLVSFLVLVQISVVQAEDPTAPKKHTDLLNRIIEVEGNFITNATLPCKYSINVTLYRLKELINICDETKDPTILPTCETELAKAPAQLDSYIEILNEDCKKN